MPVQIGVKGTKLLGRRKRENQLIVLTKRFRSRSLIVTEKPHRESVTAGVNPEFYLSDLHQLN